MHSNRVGLGIAFSFATLVVTALAEAQTAPAPVANLPEIAGVDGGSPASSDPAAGVAAPPSAAAPSAPSEDAGAAPASAVDAARAATPSAPPASAVVPEPVVPSTPLPKPPPSDADLGLTGFQFGLRVGFSVPVGIATSGTSVGDVVANGIPIGLDLGYFVTPHLYLGGYLIYGFASNAGGANSTCPNDPDISCSANLVRFGAVAQWHFLPWDKLDPWAGVGFGYDIVNLTATDSSSDDDSSSEAGSLHGLELLNLQAGLDYKPKPYFGLGPYLEVSTGHYANDLGSALTLHAWMTAGIRLRTGL